MIIAYTHKGNTFMPIPHTLHWLYDSVYFRATHSYLAKNGQVLFILGADLCYDNQTLEHLCR